MPDERPEVATLMTSAQVLRDVATELEEAQSQHPGMNSAHEAYAVILEELEEFWAEVRRPREARRSAAMYIELVQVAAMAVRAILDLQPEVWGATFYGSDEAFIASLEERADVQ